MPLRSSTPPLLLTALLLATPSFAQTSAPLVDLEASAQRVHLFLPTLPDSFEVEGVNPDSSRYDGSVEMTYDADTMVVSMTWEIGDDTFLGDGSFIDGELVVDWGQPTPAIYRITEELNLSGTWADGQGSEELSRELNLIPSIQ